MPVIRFRTRGFEAEVDGVICPSTVTIRDLSKNLYNLALPIRLNQYPIPKQGFFNRSGTSHTPSEWYGHDLPHQRLVAPRG